MRHTTLVSGVPDSLTWVVLTLAYAGRPSSPVPARLPRPGPSRSVPFTNPFTPTHPDDPPGTCTSPHPQQHVADVRTWLARGGRGWRESACFGHPQDELDATNL